MLKVELIYETGCPNVKEARVQLLRAFDEAGLPPKWQEWDRGVPESPAYVRTYGSPTILVNGQDVAEASPSNGANCCRLYADNDGGFKGVPSVETITAALSRMKGAISSDNTTAIRNNDWRNALPILPGIGIALLPKLTCPACWPAYAGILSLLGLGFINYTPYLLPLTIIFLILAVASLVYRRRYRHGYKPFILGVFAAIVVVVGKFIFMSDMAMYGGIALLVGASLWNSWPQRTIDGGSCPACVPVELLTQERNTNET